jgi:putative spermidine/putrescine transport system substrate-binding protein
MPSRRTLLAAGLAAPAVLARPAIAQAPPVLRVQAIGGAVEKTLRDSVIPEFERRHGIQVSLAVEDDVVMLPKLQIARGRPPYDVVMLDNDKAILGDGLDLWAPDQSARLSNIGAIYESCRPPATANYAFMVFEYALAYQTARFPAPPASWMDLWAPGVTVAVPHISQAYGWTFLFIAALLHGGSAEDLGPGFAAIKRLHAFKVYRTVSQGLSLFQQREVDAGLFYGHRVQQMMDAGLPVGKVVPREGSYGVHTGTQVPRGAANPEAALAWVDATLGVPYQAAFAQSLYSPTNRDCVLPPDLAARLTYGPRVDSIKEAPWAALLPQRDAVLDRWNREFGL